MKIEYSNWFWSDCNELNKDTSFAYNLAEKAWNYRQIEVNELKSIIEKQKKLSLKAIENAKAGSSIELQLAQKLYIESSPDSLKSERSMNAQLTNENLLLEAKLDNLQKQLNEQSQHIKNLEHKNKELQNLLDVTYLKL